MEKRVHLAPLSNRATDFQGFWQSSKLAANRQLFFGSKELVTTARVGLNLIDFSGLLLSLAVWLYAWYCLKCLSLSLTAFHGLFRTCQTNHRTITEFLHLLSFSGRRQHSDHSRPAAFLTAFFGEIKYSFVRHQGHPQSREPWSFPCRFCLLLLWKVIGFCLSTF